MWFCLVWFWVSVLWIEFHMTSLFAITGICQTSIIMWTSILLLECSQDSRPLHLPCMKGEIELEKSPIIWKLFFRQLVVIRYHNILTALTLIILFVEMLKFSKIKIKKNCERKIKETFWNIQEYKKNGHENFKTLVTMIWWS